MKRRDFLKKGSIAIIGAPLVGAAALELTDHTPEVPERLCDCYCESDIEQVCCHAPEINVKTLEFEYKITFDPRSTEGGTSASVWTYKDGKSFLVHNTQKVRPIKNFKHFQRRV